LTEHRAPALFALNLSTSFFNSSFARTTVATALLWGAATLISANEGDSLPTGVKKLKAPGIENFYALTDRIYSGGSPESEEAFQALARLGVKTIITVDGAKPNVELAHRFGMRYIHLPHGYDGIPAETAAKLVKAAKTFEGPIYIHCHHGRHRGPAAAAVVCESVAHWTPQAAENWLKAAGTAPDYDGLYRSVRENHPPSDEQLAKVPSDFPETTEVSDLVDTMVEIDHRWDRLKEMAKKSDAKAPSEAVLLWEQIREAQRLPEAVKHGEKFLAQLAQSERMARSMADALRVTPVAAEDLHKAMGELTHSCTSCHKEFRDSAPKKEGAF
jgi:protein tyrosine phosphatase (PTP) superfamily phosphohydrolase (DUF442 family)